MSKVVKSVQREPRDDWEALIIRYADDREICNCGAAYYTNCGEGFNAEGEHVNDLPVCRYGCSANQIDAKVYIAGRVLAELAQKE